MNSGNHVVQIQLFQIFLAIECGPEYGAVINFQTGENRQLRELLFCVFDLFSLIGQLAEIHPR